jgi:hypothetical protein
MSSVIIIDKEKLMNTFYCKKGHQTHKIVQFLSCIVQDEQRENVYMILNEKNEKEYLCHLFY